MKYELWFNNFQESGVDIFDPKKKEIPKGKDWYRVGSYEYEVALDFCELFLQIPFDIRVAKKRYRF